MSLQGYSTLDEARAERRDDYLPAAEWREQRTYDLYAAWLDQSDAPLTPDAGQVDTGRAATSQRELITHAASPSPSSTKKRPENAHTSSGRANAR